MAVSAPARAPSGVSLSCPRSRPLAQNFLPLKTITFFGRRDPRYSSPARATANRKAMAPVVPSSGAMVAGGCCPPPPPGPPPRLAPPAGYGLLDEAGVSGGGEHLRVVPHVADCGDGLRRVFSPGLSRSLAAEWRA